MFSTSKKMIVAGVLTISILGFGVSAVLAEEEMPTADASVAFLSKYVWRGYELSKDSIVIQPSITTSYKGFSANLWANLDTDYYSTSTHNWNETDFTLSYDGTYEKLGYGVGWIYYALEDGADDTQEFYGTLSYDILLSPSLTVYYDTDDFAGAWYATLGIGHSFGLTENLSLDLGLTLSYMDDNEGYSEFHDGVLSAAMSFPIGKYITITPELDWSFPLSSEAKDFYKDNSFEGDDNFVYGGVAASFSF